MKKLEIIFQRPDVNINLYADKLLERAIMSLIDADDERTLAFLIEKGVTLLHEINISETQTYCNLNQHILLLFRGPHLRGIEIVMDTAFIIAPENRFKNAALLEQLLKDAILTMSTSANPLSVVSTIVEKGEALGLVNKTLLETIIVFAASIIGEGNAHFPANSVLDFLNAKNSVYYAIFEN